MIERESPGEQRMNPKTERRQQRQSTYDKSDERQGTTPWWFYNFVCIPTPLRPPGSSEGRRTQHYQTKAQEAQESHRNSHCGYQIHRLVTNRF